MKILGILISGVLFSAGAYATDGCPALNASYSNCTVSPAGAVPAGQTETFAFTQGVNAQGQTTYHITTSIQQPNQAATSGDADVAVNGAVTQTNSDGSTLVTTTSCSNQTLIQDDVLSSNGAVVEELTASISSDSAGNLTYSLKQGSAVVTLSCKML